ncbi:hypothetical protein [Sulfurimonas sp.]|uniref:hypothetical protein n=1 Tax=Sulfurimonas sp. TaxID=2022749 RepID=UPI00260E2CEC|nr:hypothetical protein [Sulfurimonas sp.]MCW8895471.1 hypothetical protein [Sulfurimonas sp.]
MKSSGSLLDIHKYSKDAFRHLYYKLSDSDFNRSYITKDDPIASVTGIIWDITQGDEEVKKIVKKMDNIDGIKAQNSKSPNEKRVETWLKKAYFEHLYGGYSISRSYLLSFMISIIKPSGEEGKKKLKYSTTRYFEQYNDKFKKRLKRCRTNERVLELQKQYPKLNIIDAYAYGLIIDKFNTTNEDLDWFEKIIKILTKKKEI